MVSIPQQVGIGQKQRTLRALRASGQRRQHNTDSDQRHVRCTIPMHEWKKKRNGKMPRKKERRIKKEEQEKRKGKSRNCWLKEDGQTPMWWMRYDENWGRILQIGKEEEVRICEGEDKGDDGEFGVRREGKKYPRFLVLVAAPPSFGYGELRFPSFSQSYIPISLPITLTVLIWSFLFSSFPFFIFFLFQKNL